MYALSVGGKRTTKGAILETTDPTTIYTAAPKVRPELVAICVTNTDTSNTCEVLVEWACFKTSEAYVIRMTDLAAGASLVIDDIPIAMDDGDEIIATAENANDLHALITVIENTGLQGAVVR